MNKDFKFVLFLIEERIREGMSLGDDKILVNQFIDGLDTSKRYLD